MWRGFNSSIEAPDECDDVGKEREYGWIGRENKFLPQKSESMRDLQSVRVAHGIEDQDKTYGRDIVVLLKSKVS